MVILTLLPGMLQRRITTFPSPTIYQPTVKQPRRYCLAMQTYNLVPAYDTWAPAPSYRGIPFYLPFARVTCLTQFSWPLLLVLLFDVALFCAAW